MANNPYVNKVIYGNNTLIDISADTVEAEYLLEGYTAHGKDGSLITGTYIPEGGSAVVVTEEQDSHGGVIKHITAIDLSEDTIIAGALLTGYTAHDRQGHAITGTLAHGTVDTSNDTVTAAVLLSGYTAHDANGAQVQGTMVATDLSQDTVTAATLLYGYTAHDASGNAITGIYQINLEDITVTPSESEQIITPSSGYDGIDEITVNPISSTYVGSGITRDPTPSASGAVITIPTGYYTENTTKSVTTTTVATPSISVSNAGVITATNTQTSGYVTGATTTATENLTTQAATAITPTTSQQTAVAANVYTTGAVTVNAIQTETKSITVNGTYTPATGKYFSSVSVDVSSGTTINNQNKTVTPLETEQEITFDSGYTGLGTVTVEAIDDDYVGSGITRLTSSDLTASGATVTVPSGYVTTSIGKSVATTTQAVPSISVNSSTGLITATATQTAGYVSAGTETDTEQLSTQASTTITPTTAEQTAVAAGKYTLGAVKIAAIQTETKSATPSETEQTVTPSSGKYLTSVTIGAIDSDYIGSAIDRRDSTDLSASGDTITVPAGYYETSASKSVSAGTAGTPVATKGAVSSHSISVTPSVTNTTGYITGSTKTGTAVTVSASELVSGTKNISANGTGIDVTNYASVDVAVPKDTPVLQTKSVTYTPATNEQTATILADTGYDALSEVDITVEAMPNGSVTAPASISGSSASVSTGTNTLTLSKTISVTPSVTTAGYVSSGMAGNSSVSLTASINTRSSSSLSVSGDTVTAPAGYYATDATKSVDAGTEGTPIATKGTVSSHSISVTPSVTNTEGYISGGTHNGTAVTVSASELVSGTYSVTSSGTKDVTNYESASVPAMTLPTAASSTHTGTSKATISRSTSAQYINIPTGFNDAAAYYTISATANGSVTAPASISGTSATVSTGTNTLTLTKSVSVTPNVTTAGYISSGTAGNSSVSLTASVTTKGVATYNTSSTDQTIASGTYLTGTQTIKAVTTSGISAANIKAGVTVNVGDSNDADRIIGVTGTFTSDATALAGDIVEGETAYINGQLVTGTLNVATYYTGSSAPASSLGEDGDIYLQG